MLDPDVRRVLDGTSIAHLATVMPDGSPHTVPLWIGAYGDRIVFLTDYDMSLAAVSKHLKVLETAGLISRGREQQWRPCHLEAEPLHAVSEWLEDYRVFWERNLDGKVHRVKVANAALIKPAEFKFASGLYALH